MKFAALLALGFGVGWAARGVHFWTGYLNFRTHR